MYKSYIGCKIIEAKPANYKEYREEVYGDAAYISNIAESTPGYLVRYPGITKNEVVHRSWSPKEVFEKSYRLITEGEKCMQGVAISENERSEMPDK